VYQEVQERYMFLELKCINIPWIWIPLSSGFFTLRKNPEYEEFLSTAAERHDFAFPEFYMYLIFLRKQNIFVVNPNVFNHLPKIMSGF
jgi:hypothetical protein